MYIYDVYNYVGLWGKAVFLSLSYQHYEGASHPEVSSLVICNKSSLMHWHQQWVGVPMHACLSAYKGTALRKGALETGGLSREVVLTKMSFFSGVAGGWEWKERLWEHVKERRGVV